MGFEKYRYYADYSGYYKALDEAEKWCGRVALAKSKGRDDLAAQAEIMHLHYSGQAMKAELALKSRFPLFNPNVSH